MDRDEMRRILEEIARNCPNATARVAAIRGLRQLEEAEEAKKEPEANPVFAELDAWRERRHTKGPKSA